MIKKLRNKLLILNMVMVSLVMIAAFVTIYVVMYTNTISDNSRKLDEMPAAPLAQICGESLGGALPDIAQGGFVNTRIVMSVPIDYTSSFTACVTSDGEPIGVMSRLDVDDSVYRDAVKASWSSGDQSGHFELGGRTWQYSIVHPDMRRVPGAGTVFSGQFLDVYQINFLDVTQSYASLTRLLVTFVIVGAIVLVVLFTVSLFFANRSIRPIEENWVKQKQFVTDASHELKTPIAIVGANVDALEASSDQTVASQKKWVDYIRAELSRMGKLVNDLLYLAKAEDGAVQPMAFDLAETVRGTVASLEAVMYEKGISFTQTIEPDLIVVADEEKIKQALVILLDNAVKYTPTGGSIMLSVASDRGYALVSVKNTGPGIAQDDLPNIFDRFYRPDKSRSGDTGGYGLGLSIAKAIIERAGGKITAASAGGVTEFTFTVRVERHAQTSGMENGHPVTA